MSRIQDQEAWDQYAADHYAEAASARRVASVPVPARRYSFVTALTELRWSCLGSAVGFRIAVLGVATSSFLLSFS